MSNEYKDYYKDKERSAHEFYGTLREGKYPVVSIEELEEYLPLMNEYGVRRLLIERTPWSDDDRYIVGVDNYTLVRWRGDLGRYDEL